MLVEDKINTIQTLASDRIVIQEAGFFEIFIDNQAQTPVYYDNFSVTHNVSRASEVNAYYSFGMIIENFSKKPIDTDEVNYYKYNGKELQGDLKRNWYDYGARIFEVSDYPIQRGTGVSYVGFSKNGKFTSINRYIKQLLGNLPDNEQSKLMSDIESYFNDLFNIGNEHVIRYTGKEKHRIYLENFKNNFDEHIQNISILDSIYSVNILSSRLDAKM